MYLIASGSIKMKMINKQINAPINKGMPITRLRLLPIRTTAASIEYINNVRATYKEVFKLFINDGIFHE